VSTRAGRVAALADAPQATRSAASSSAITHGTSARSPRLDAAKSSSSRGYPEQFEEWTGASATRARCRKR
jgi:hypothetical protein